MKGRAQCHSGLDRAAPYQASSNLDRHLSLAHFVRFGIATCFLSNTEMNLRQAKLSDCGKEPRSGWGSH